MNTQLANDYFNKSSKITILGIVLIALGCLLAILCFVLDYGWFSIIFIVLIVVGFCCKKLTVSDSQYDQLVEQIYATMLDSSLEVLGITEQDIQDIEPICSRGYEYEDCRSRMGKDGKLRTNKLAVTYLMFGKHQVFYYQRNMATTSNKTYDKTHVCFYTDIASVSTGEQNNAVRKHSVRQCALTIVTNGGSKITMTLNNLGKSQQSINDMRAMLLHAKVDTFVK